MYKLFRNDSEVLAEAAPDTRGATGRRLNGARDGVVDRIGYPNTEECMYSDEIVENAWMRARARCEGGRVSQGRPAARCDTPLLWSARGAAPQEGAWEANRTGDPTSGGWHAVKDCEILCWGCFRQTRGVARQTMRTAAARPIDR